MAGKAKNIMIQGTMSNAGKSLFTAGLLRVFAQAGIRCAPFKSQNMALNSFVTLDGLEMGRAQAMQAQAAGIAPDVCMNPILLKPTSDTGSQVIVNGEVIGNMKAVEYFKRKKEFIPTILDAYHKLEEKYDVIVIEGAGSPAEINLRENDIVNMGLAELVDAPVLLIGDIDRGGVFAQLFGTYALLKKEEQKRIQGFLMNKFRGDKALLQSGIDMLYQKCQVPVLGVIPYTDLDIEDEDSLAQRLIGNRRPDLIDIAVIHLPHISNFTDFNPLENVENVSLRYVSTLRELGTPDLIILPGTKNTMHDLRWLRENGLEGKIKSLVRSEISLLMGICGGFQMLGRYLEDPLSVEEGGSLRGMDMLPVRTTFGEIKVRTRVSGRLFLQKGIFTQLSDSVFTGYEIHMGATESIGDADRFSELTYLDEHGGALDGFVKGFCLGTYIHGIFEEGTFCRELLQLLFDRKGLVFQGKKKLDYRAYQNSQYDLLAETVRENVDLKSVYHILGMV